jgi:hypothetical protein
MKKTILFFPRSELSSLLDNNFKPATTVIPEWYKKIKPLLYNAKKWTVGHRNQSATTSLKWCQPFLDSMSAGYVLTLPVDILVHQGDAVPEIVWRIDADFITEHPKEQIGSMDISEEFYPIVFKFWNMTGTKLPNGYSALFTHPLNRPDLPFYSFSGIVDLDDYNQAVAIPFLLKRSFDGLIPAGTPIAQIIPFKREDWVSERKEFDPRLSEEQSLKFWSKLYRSYKENFWKRKSYQ